MLSDKPVMVMLPATDIKRATDFYGGKLGLKVVEETEGMVILEVHGVKIMVYKREQTKAEHTAFTFVVENVEHEVKELKEKGIVFEEYDTEEIKTENSIATHGELKSAWFKDTEGNILAIGNKG